MELSDFPMLAMEFFWLDYDGTWDIGHLVRLHISHVLDWCCFLLSGLSSNKVFDVGWLRFFSNIAAARGFESENSATDDSAPMQEFIPTLEGEMTGAPPNIAIISGFGQWR